MSVPRFFVPIALQVGLELELPSEASHHALRALRLRIGEPVILFNGQGGEYTGRLAAAHKQAVVSVETFSPREAESPLQIHLAQALASGDKMDWVVEKAVELGATAVHPIESARSVLRLSGERALKRQAHWQAISIRASEQCGRNRIMSVAEPTAFQAWLSNASDATGAGARFILAPGAQPVHQMDRVEQPVTVMVGPEGGWTDAELALAVQHGFAPVSLGPRVLRTETAGLAFFAALQARWGDL